MNGQAGAPGVSSIGEARRPAADRLSWLWLAIGFGFLLFSNGMQIAPIATWLGPLFLLRFMRTQKAWLALLAGYLANGVAFTVYWRPALVDAGDMFTVFSVAFALVFFVPYAIDRLFAGRIRGFAGTLVLPCAFVATEYLIHLVSPLGTFFLIPYTQRDNLALLQIISVTGMWSVTFLVMWSASVANYAWEEGFAPRRIGAGALVYAAVMAAVLVFGGLRLSLGRPVGPTVQVSALTTNVDKEALPEPGTPREERLLAGELTDDDRAAMSATMDEINADLLGRTRRQARAGSRIVTWTEYNAHAWSEAEAAFMAEAKAVAREEGIFLVFPFVVVEPDRSKRPASGAVWVNKSVMITPQGEVAYEYVKHNLLVGPESDCALRGPREIKSIETPYGRLSSVICLDMEYPDFNRLAGAQGVDIMLSGAIDGTPSTRGNPLHSNMAALRTIEEGYSLARGGFYGANVAVDYQGRLLGSTNHYTAEDRTVTARLPVEGVRTIYSRIGDVFPWACVAATVILLAAASIQGRRQGRKSPPAV